MPDFKLPDEIGVRSFIGIMFDGLEVTQQESATIPEDGYVGTFIDDDGRLVALAVADLSISAYSACALTMFPVNTANEAIKEGKLENSLVANLGELMNIFSRFFMDNSTPHLRWDKIASYSDIEGDVKEFLQSGKPKVSHLFKLPNYGEGTVTLIAA